MVRLSTKLQDVSWKTMRHCWMLKRWLSRFSASAHSSLGYINMTVPLSHSEWWTSKLTIFANGLRQLMDSDREHHHCPVLCNPSISKMLSQNLSATLIFNAVELKGAKGSFLLHKRDSWRNCLFHTFLLTNKAQVVPPSPFPQRNTHAETTETSDLGKTYPKHVFLFSVGFHSWGWRQPTLFDLLLLQGPYEFCIWQWDSLLL